MEKLGSVFGKILTIVYMLFVGGLLLWYNINLYYAHKMGKLGDWQYIIFLLIPALVLIIVTVIVSNSNNKNLKENSELD